MVKDASCRRPGRKRIWILPQMSVSERVARALLEMLLKRFRLSVVVELNHDSRPRGSVPRGMRRLPRVMVIQALAEVGAQARVAILRMRGGVDQVHVLDANRTGRSFRMARGSSCCAQLLWMFTLFRPSFAHATQGVLDSSSPVFGPEQRRIGGGGNRTPVP